MSATVPHEATKNKGLTATLGFAKKCAYLILIPNMTSHAFLVSSNHGVQAEMNGLRIFACPGGYSTWVVVAFSSLYLSCPVSYRHDMTMPLEG